MNRLDWSKWDRQMYEQKRKFIHDYVVLPDNMFMWRKLLLDELAKEII